MKYATGYRSFDYVRRYYGVPAKRGMRVTVYDGREGTITCGAGHYIRIRLDGEKRSRIFHPTWKLTYHSGAA